MTIKASKWPRGLNTLVSNTQIPRQSLSLATNIQLVEDGKIQCPRDGQAYYGSSSGSRVTGLYAYYKSDGTNKLLRTSGTALQLYGSGSWSNVSGKTYTTGLNTNAVMAYDRLYLVNGTDNLTYYDGSSITTFTEISAPSAPTPTRVGAGHNTGSYTYSYKITAVTAIGETTGSTAGSVASDQSELTTDKYVTVSWSSVTSATGYNIYGRKDGAWYFIAYVEGNTSTSYDDTGTVTPNEVFTPPEGNSTGGQVGSYIAVYKDSLFIAGDPDNPSRLYYSGGGDKINDFTISNGGGFIDVSKNDGQSITGLIVFKDSLIVFKRNSIYKFGFSTSGLPQMELINPAIGAVAPRSIIAVENDILFASDRGIFSLGNAQGFAFDVLRTNELSSPVRSNYQAINPTYLDNISAVYATKNNTNLAIFSYTPSGSTTNSEALILDVERGGWYVWTNVNANCWLQYRDSDGVQHVLYGDDSSGYVKEALVSGSTEDFGSAISSTFRLAGESFKGDGAQYLTLKDVDLVLRKPQGTATMNILRDGVKEEYTAPITTVSPTINFGYYTFKDFTFSDSYGTGSVTEPDNNKLVSFKNVNLRDGRNYIIEIDNNQTSSFTLLLARMYAKPRSERYRKSEDLLS